MLELHFGVIEQPYSTLAGFKSNVDLTTGDVAEFLEAKYHPFEIFFELHADEIGEYMAEALAGAVKTFLETGVSPINPLAQSESSIKAAFEKFLSEGELETLGFSGIPTQAAIEGRSHRFAKGRKPQRRVSLIDTGLFQTSSYMWFSGINSVRS